MPNVAQYCSCSIITASKWVVGGERRQDGLRLAPLRAYMGDVTLVTRTEPCTKRLLERFNKSLRRARMKMKPSKSRSTSVSRGKVTDRKFYVGEEEIPSIRER